MLKSFKRILAGISAAVVAVLAPATVLAYGPVEGQDGRVYFDYNNTATYPNYPAFNSFKNSPTWGFEPDFMSIKLSSDTNWASGDTITLQPGKTYDVVVFYHNNAPVDTNIAYNTRMDIDFPIVVKGGVPTKGTAGITASNATPQQVWSTITFNSANDMLLRYKQGSAYIKYSDGSTKTLPNEGKNLFNGGQLLGANLDGQVPGCDKNSGFVQFQIVADQPNFTAEKQVRIAGTTDWKESVNVKTGDTVEFMLTYKNTGTTDQSNITFIDKLPAGLSYVDGSTCIRNSNHLGGNASICGGRGDQLPNGINTDGGVQVASSHAPGAATYIWFQAKVDAKVACGTQSITNSGTIRTADGQITDTAKLVVDSGKVCVNTPDLPKTGPASTAAAIIGTGSIATAGAYYIASRKKLN